VNPYSTALVHQPFKSDFDSPKPGWLRVGYKAQESIWIQDEDTINLTCHWTNIGMFAFLCVHWRSSVIPRPSEIQSIAVQNPQNMTTTDTMAIAQMMSVGREHGQAVSSSSTALAGNSSLLRHSASSSGILGKGYNLIEASP